MVRKFDPWSLAAVVLTATLTAPAAVVDVTIDEFSFTPPVVFVSSGDTVRWTNAGALTHTSTSGGPDDPVPGTVWDSGPLLAGDTFSATFTEPLASDTFCTVHPTLMFGKVYVDATGVQATMIPVATDVGEAGPLEFTAFVFNLDADPARVQLALVVSPPGFPSAVLFDAPVTLPGGFEASRAFSVAVPAGFPTGTYTVRLTVTDRTSGAVLVQEEDDYDVDVPTE